ncbi:MAG: NlpC/P60 family protein [Gemmatimonadota bacterium]
MLPVPHTAPAQPPGSMAGGAPLRVRSALANLRRDPSHAAELVSQLVLGEPATELERRDGWVRVAGRDGYPGWVDAGALARAQARESGPELVWLRRDGVLRARPECGSSPLCDLTLGARAAAAGGAPDRTRGGALEVLLPDGTRGWAEAAGWAEAGDLPRLRPREGRAVVETALSLRGAPYLWGGTSSKALDCSGLVQRVFELHGVPLPRDAWQQAGEGVEVDPGPGGSRLEAGDLLLFAEGGTRVTHVALALGQSGRFVHSSTRRAGVGVDGLDPSDPLHAPALSRTAVAFRRVL